jgi:hypothetical protein
MATDRLNYTGNTTSFIGIPSGEVDLYVTGEGSVHTIVASGTTGQTALFEGSIDSINWITLSTLTVGASNSSDFDVIRHTFPWVRVTGTAYVTMSRGV